MIGGRSSLLAAATGRDYGNWTGNYSNVSLLLRNGAPGPLIPLDESPTPKTITSFGNVGFSTTTLKYGSSALQLPGGSYLGAQLTGSLGTGAFTIEAWIYPANTTAGYRGIVGDDTYTAAGGFAFYQNGTSLEIWKGVSRIINATNALTALVFQHIAWTRDAEGVNRCFVNGVQVGPSATDSNNYTATLIRIGLTVSGANSFYFNGFIDDLRITQGIARYTANFTPPVAELPADIINDPSYNSVSLLLRNGTPGPLILADESPTPKTITAVGNAFNTTSVVKYGTSAMAFDGSGDYFQTSASIDFNFGNNPFTIEAWVNVSVLTSFAGVITVMDNEPTNDLDGYAFIVDSNGALVFSDYTGGNTVFSLSSAAGLIATGQWYHVAVCKEGTGVNQVRLFINGSIVATGTRNASIPISTSGQPARIGAWRYPTAFRYFNGIIDDLRITKGVARYTKNFLPPPAELPAI